MGPGRPRKPTAVKVMEGTYRADRSIPDEVAPELLASIPDPPEGLGDWGCREWHTVCRWLHDVGNLASTDLSLLAMYCNEIDNYWQYDALVKSKGAVFPIRDKTGQVINARRSPYTVLRREAQEQALRLASQFGFTPAARTRMMMGPMPEKKPTGLRAMIVK